MPRTRLVLKALGVVGFNIVVAFGLLEGFFVFMLHAPRVVAVAGGPMRRLVQQIYRHFNRDLIQFDAPCARYDPEVTYTLRPGACTFGNIEFRNEYHINHAGVRDEEASLAGPETIVIGDSHAMGWGVNQNESLVRVLARQTGQKTLNAAVSSYGTVREKLLLDRLDTSRLRVLVVQYTDNDMPENRTFREQGDHLPITSEAAYDTIAGYYASQQSYYPGKYVYRLFEKVLRLEAVEPDQVKMEPMAPEQEAELFIHVLTHAGRTSLESVQVIVFEINQEFDHPRAFIRALDSVARRPENAPFVRRLIALDTTRLLTPNDFYVLDDHMRGSGHLAIGTALAKIIQK